MKKTVNIKNIEIGVGLPKVCVPLVGCTEEEILQQVRDIVLLSKTSRIDIVEFRADYYNRLNDFEALSALMNNIGKLLKDIILLFTIRSEKEGGQALTFDIPSIEDINAHVIANNLADMVDVELFSGEESVKRLIDTAKEKDVKIIMSNHDFVTTPDSEEIIKRLTLMQEYGADIAKIAVMPQNKLQLMELLNAVTMMNEKYAKVPVVAISMGALGAISRITGEIFGSAITFATLAGASAPGQIPVEDVNRILSDIHRFCV